MTTEHPITPPPELVREWNEAAIGTHFPPYGYSEYIATHAARWGADQELRACCDYMQREDFHGFAKELLAARRPKPPSLAEQGHRILVENTTTFHGRVELEPEEVSVIRTALERLQELEKGNE